MNNEENLDKQLMEELAKIFSGEDIIPLPVNLKVEQDDVPDIERWKSHE